MFFRSGLVLAVFCSAVMTMGVIGSIDLYFGDYSNGTTLLVLAFIAGVLLYKSVSNYLKRITVSRSCTSPTASAQEPVIPLAVYNTVLVGCLVMALLIGIGGPLTYDDYLGKFLNPMIGLFLLSCSAGIWFLKQKFFKQ